MKASPTVALVSVNVDEDNRCRAVQLPLCGSVHVIGYATDLDATELLSISLLAQEIAAMARQGARRDASGRSRTRSFRRAFLLGFAKRVRERLAKAADGPQLVAGEFLKQLAADVQLEPLRRTAGKKLPLLAGR